MDTTYESQMETPELRHTGTCNRINKNLWISASAGSGKTKRLVDRFLALLLGGVQATSIVCITFTKSAAAEMLSRLVSELSSWALSDEEELATRVKELTGEQASADKINFARSCFAKFLNTQDDLHIGTIHSFCQFILNKFPFESKVNFRAQVLDDVQRVEFIERAKIFLLRDEFMLHRPSVKSMFAQVHDLSIDALLEKILFIDSMAPTIFESQASIDECIHTLSQKLNVKNKPDPAKFVEEIRRLSEELVDESELACVTDVRRALMEPDHERVLSKLRDLHFTKAGTLRLMLLSKKQKESMPEVHSFIMRIQEIQVEYMRACAAYECIQNTKGLLHMGYGFINHYRAAKQAAGCSDYVDLIRSCLKLLQDSEYSQWIRCHMNDKFSHIMVDEAQDINLEQWTLIQLLIKEFFYNAYNNSFKTLFVVGDPKQAIYSFQGTSPYLFIGIEQAIKTFAKQFDIEVCSESQRESFRSDPVILSFIDQVFAKLRHKDPAYFIEDTCHLARKKFAGSAVEIWPAILNSSLATFEDDDEVKQNGWQLPGPYRAEKPQPARLLAIQLAAKIKELIDIAGYKPSDIMILVRKRDAFMWHMIRALKAAELPISSADRLTLSENIAIKDLIALGRFILCPSDDYNLVCLLKSPICGLMNEDEIFSLCQRTDGQTIWDKLRLDLAYICFYSKLDILLRESSIHSPYALFAHVLDVLNMRTNFVSRFGSYINEVLDEFLELCLNFEDSHHKSLALFLKWFSSSKLEVKRALSTENVDEVRIMTVHAAKGLQAKVVILPDTLSGFQPPIDRILFDSNTGQLIFAGKNANMLEAYTKLSDNIRLQNLQESYRLLYVALTRASERLLICGWSNRKTISKNSWYEVLSEVQSEQASCS
jgi:ATP-dependent helicase/nuclease subunit A